MVDIETAGLDREVEFVGRFVRVGRPEEEVAGTAADAGDEGAVRQEAGSPDGVVGESLGDVGSGGGTVLPGEADGERLLHVSERVGGLAEAGRDQPVAVRAEGEGAHAAVMDLLSAFIKVQAGGFEGALGLAGGGSPLMNFAIEVTGQNRGAVGRKEERVNVPSGAGEVAHGRAIGGFPEAHGAVVPAAGDERAVRTDGHGAHPAVVSLDHARGARVFRVRRPPAQGVVAAAGEQSGAVRGHGQRGDP